MYLVDTNVFLELLLNRSNVKLAYNFFRKIETERIKAVISSFTLHSIEVLLERKRSLNEVVKFLSVLEQWKNLKVYQTNLAEEKLIAENANRWNLDFDDAVQYYVALKHGAKIVTFDRHFQKVKGKQVAILEPF